MMKKYTKSIVASLAVVTSFAFGSHHHKPQPTPTPTHTVTPTPSKTPTPTPSARPVPAPTGIQWGVYQGNGTLAQFEALVGKPANVTGVFVGVCDPFPNQDVGNRTLLIYLETSDTQAQIASGKDDGCISKFVFAANAYGKPVILAPWVEMNGDWSPWGYPQSASSFIAMWQHVHNLFAGLPNVKWAWDVNNDSATGTSIGVWYPGDAYVDIVGVDGFNFGGQTEAQVFPPALFTQLKSYGKPVWILSTAAAEDGTKAKFITDLGTAVRANGLAGFVWFNENKEKNWLINSDAAALAAFKSILP